ncbi:MAG: RNA polymerase sigma factor [Ruminococcaceae bacterium]|nr:RNA polymerase sigma factor [Oscillospiraceae bacterium]
MKIKPEFCFEEKYKQYSNMIYRICISYLGNKHDAEDALQDIFIKLAYHAPDFTDKEDEKAWIIRVSINKCKNILKSFWHKHVTKTDDLFIQPEIMKPDMDSVLNDIIKLDVKQKEVIYLYYIEGFKIWEISHILKISESCVKMRLSRGKKQLKHILEESDE